MHIRRGDACHTPKGIEHNQHCVHTWRYIEAITLMRVTYPHLSRVFVATNGGPLLIQEIQTALPDLEIIIQNISDRAKYACCEEADLDCSSGPGCLHTDDRLLLEKNEGGGGGHAHEIVSDILGLASCDVLIGTMTSQVSDL